MGSKAGQVQETSAEKASADHATALLADYRQRWEPLQQNLASQIEQEGAPDSSVRKLAAGKSSTDTAIAFDNADSTAEKNLSNAGSLPGSAKSNLAVTGMGTDAAASTGLGHMMSDQAIDDAYTQGLGALTALGRGQSATVSNSLTNLASQSAAQAQTDASISLNNQEGNARLGAQVAGFGLQQASKGFGTQAPSTNWGGEASSTHIPSLGGINVGGQP